MMDIYNMILKTNNLWLSMIISAEILLNSAKIHTTRFSWSCDVKYIGIVPFQADSEADVIEYP